MAPRLPLVTPAFWLYSLQAALKMLGASLPGGLYGLGRSVRSKGIFVLCCWTST